MPIYFLFLETPHEFVKLSDLTYIKGLAERLDYPSNPKIEIATLGIREMPDKTFCFYKSGQYASQRLKEGDSISILALTKDLQENVKNIRAYELKKGDFLIFTVDTYNSSLNDGMLITQIFFWIAVVYVVLYLGIKKTKLAWIMNKLNSPDPNFQPPADTPNFNEFLEDTEHCR